MAVLSTTLAASPYATIAYFSPSSSELLIDLRVRPKAICVEGSKVCMSPQIPILSKPRVVARRGGETCPCGKHAGDQIQT
jgi:hypothetical protein